MEDHLTDAGHQVVGIADTLQDAVNLIQETQPDLALVDIQLAEGCSGLDVARELNAHGVPCVFTTGNCPGRDIDDALGCLHKPFNHIQLIGAVNAANAVLVGETADIPREMHLFRR
ncbi:MAG: response regulator [Pseudomonadota bacterium]|nr:response regulator [Pseudomonadota bacterium]